MALMTSMRERMHVVLWFLLIMFLLSMTIGGLVGGANIIDLLLGRVNPVDAIGVVNGSPISPDEFSRAVNLRIEQYRADGREPDERLLHNIRNEVWETYVEDILIKQKIDEMGLSASDEEVLYHLRNNPPPFLAQDPVFLTDGVFDRVKYDQAVKNPQGNEWVQIEQFMKNTFVPNYKLQQYIASSVVVTSDDVHKQFVKENIEYTIEGIHVIGQKQADDIEEPTQDEMLAIYEDEKDSYAIEETRNISYVSWKKSPTMLDTNRVLEDALEIYNEARSGVDFARLADQYSEDPGNQVTPDSSRGGNLGWFGKGQMAPKFEESAFSADAGDIVGPVLTRFGYHIIKVHDKREKDGKEEVNAAHILLSINMGSQTRETLRRESTRFSYDAQDYGFEAALDTHNVTAQVAVNLLAQSNSIPRVGFMRDAVRFAFDPDSEVGSVSDRLENQDYYIVAVLDSIIPAGVRSFSEVESQIKRRLTVEKQKSAAQLFAEEIRGKIDEGASLTDLVSDDSRLDLVATDKKKLSRGFNSIGRSPNVVGALLNSSEGDIIGPVATARGYTVVRILNISKLDSTDYESKELEILATLTTEAQNNAFESWINDLKEDVDIIDNRKYYY